MQFVHPLCGQQIYHHLLETLAHHRQMCVLYNSDCCEGAASTVSIHKTKKGAEMAMEFHKNEKLKEWEKECKEYPPTKEYPFDFDQGWGVRECELLP